MSVDYKIKSHLKSTKILVAEDDAVMITLLRDVLTVMGFGQMVFVKDGKRALDEIAKHEFDLIFCDWRMNGMSGLEFTKALRAYPDYTKCYTPIIMLTGNARLEDVEIARDAGVTEYMVKPFSVKSLCAKIKSIIERPRSFIMSDLYKGPDRRRRSDFGAIPQGIDRRSSEFAYVEIE